MSAGTRVKLEDARDMAIVLAEILELPRYVLAGSARRGLATVGDLDLVVPMPPGWPARHTGEKGAAPDPLYERLCERVHRVEGGIFTPRAPLGREVRGLNPGFRSCVLELEVFKNWPVRVEIDRYDPGANGNFGWILALRTGPDAFCRRLVGALRRALATKAGEEVSREGYIRDADGTPMATPIEKSVFTLAGLRWTPATERDAAARAAA